MKDNIFPLGGFIFQESSTSTFGRTEIKNTSSNRILIPRSKSHLSPSNLNTRPWNSLQIATRSSKHRNNKDQAGHEAAFVWVFQHAVSGQEPSETVRQWNSAGTLERDVSHPPSLEWSCQVWACSDQKRKSAWLMGCGLIQGLLVLKTVKRGEGRGRS